MGEVKHVNFMVSASNDNPLSVRAEDHRDGMPYIRIERGLCIHPSLYPIQKSLVRQ